ncbi:MAG: hypothetical protein A2Z83_04285 [Omnitrophica bacterium GWA2_52_8]|nr:MAG: hypothetical protein A2Z83_04285 [Omnitrophica bacterium GWA2_52_8]
MKAVNGEALDIIFRQARTHSYWRKEPVSGETLRAVYDLMKMGPTSANSSPARVLFIVSQEAKARLLPARRAGESRKDKNRAGYGGSCP